MDSPEHIDVLTGCPSCPECGEFLKMRSMPIPPEAYWFCPSCKTEWNTFDLIAAINRELLIKWQRGEDEPE